MALRQPKLNVLNLEGRLKATVQGEVRFDDGSRALYATDGSNYRQLPIGVVVPHNSNDVIATIAACHEFNIPILSRGGGTSLAGQCCNIAVVIDMSKYMHHILSLDPVRRLARVQPGCVLDKLRDAAERFTLTFAPDPSTHTHCTLGGMIGNNSCGVHSLMGGKTVENIESLEIITYDGLQMTVGPTSDLELQAHIRAGGRRGEIYSKLKLLRDKYADLIRERYPKIPRRVSGYNLDQLLPENGFNVAKALIGTESTCVTVLEATTRLVYSPPERVLLVLGYDDVYQAADAVPEILKSKPIGLEGLDEFLIEDMKKKKLHPQDIRLLPEGKGWLLCEFGAPTRTEAESQAKALIAQLSTQAKSPSTKLYDDEAEVKLLWEIRESGLGATARVPGEPDTWEGWEDSAVPPEVLGDYLRDLRKLYEKFRYHGAFYGHFGQGCLHTRINFELKTHDGIKKYRAFMEEATSLVVSYGGSLSGEHGDGQSRAEFLPKMFGEELVQAFAEFKEIWDPDYKMNPGKLVKPYKIDENLRFGTSYHPAQPTTHFRFPEDSGSFSRATERCVGVGKCRREKGGTMCPSYMVTREEQDSTRGRARLFFEMFQGESLKEGWTSQAVYNALDLCLACKGCKGDCPMNVDMATYKAEFLSHYYKRKQRPRHAYAMGLIDIWAWLAKFAPAFANFITQTPGIGALAKLAAGIDQRRKTPRFAKETFKEWFFKRPVVNRDNPKVLLWPDTFNNHFFPETAKAATEVLEAAGFRVQIPKLDLCCGRPLYDFGFLVRAKHLLQKALTTLAPEIREGMKVVGLEPSCTAVFRDELTNLFPNDEDAKRLSAQTVTLSEFLEKHAKDFKMPQLQRKAVVQAHCHHKAIMKFNAEQNVMKKMGLEVTSPNDGCCGMAGSFGFESGEHYEISQKVGELHLLPAIRNTPNDELIIADGFSCREQIFQASGRTPMHLAQVIQMALHEGPSGPAGAYPENKYIEPEAKPLPLLTFMGIAATAGLLFYLSNKRPLKRMEIT